MPVRNFDRPDSSLSLKAAFKSILDDSPIQYIIYIPTAALLVYTPSPFMGVL